LLQGCPQWSQGCTDAVRLHAEIQVRGYYGARRVTPEDLQVMHRILFSSGTRSCRVLEAYW
jgi:hypothetical protein